MTTTPLLTLIEACEDGDLLGQWFRDRGTWAAWFAFLAALFGLPMTPEQQEVFRRHTRRECLPARPFAECWLACGRRSGKSFILAVIAVFLACFRNYSEFLGPGERGTVMVLAADRKQARVIMRYIRGIIVGTPLLSGMIEGQLRADGFDLNNRVTIEVGTASFRTSRGYAFVAVLADEVAFWPSDTSAEPDYEILDAIRPGMASIPGSVLLCASSPYAKRGALWDAFRTYYGKDDPAVLVWRADTRSMNPTIPEDVISRAMARDAATASAEYFAEFRSDVAAFLSREAVDAVITPGCHERPRIAGVRYSAFTDPSGGSSDSMTLAIGHVEIDGSGREIAILDAIREIAAPFSPEAAVKELAQLLSLYSISEVIGDRYGGEWPAEAFRRQGIVYKTSDRTKSQLYVDLLPILNSRRAELLDLPRLTAQLCSLERRTARGGRDSIDHPPNSQDDVANAAAGALTNLCRPKFEIDDDIGGVVSIPAERLRLW
ncbi:hypothetical protein [Bradyrhizobium diazoefficiens]|uniref:hypothetical protein n=1 Tax=Bradyrhizobium diazoefficiens TaxID=1355477 RepID=UPI003834DF26